MVLQRPEIPLHTNGSENDIRYQVTRRKVSAGTRSDLGRNCRDALLGLAKTCAKHGIAFWDYLGSRLNVQGQPAGDQGLPAVLPLLGTTPNETILESLAGAASHDTIAPIATSVCRGR